MDSSVWRRGALSITWIIFLLGCTAQQYSSQPSDPSLSADTLVDHSGKLRLQWPPVSEPFRPYQDELKGRGDMEALVWELNQVFAFKYDVTVVVRQCGSANAFWSSSRRTIDMCLESFEKIARTYQDQPADEFSRLVIGTWYYVLLHELGHALYSMFDFPLLGSEEDAVDDFAAIIMILADEDQFAAAAASTDILWSEDEPPDLERYAGIHSLSEQRFFNVLCLLHGSDPVRYPDNRGVFYDRNCADEYKRKRRTWEQLLTPWLRAGTWPTD